MSVVLLILNQSDDCEAFRAILGSGGYTAHDIRGASEAPARIAECHPLAILIAADLPGTGCTDLCRSLRSDRSMTGMPVLIIAAGDDDPAVLPGLQAGADDYITKPFSHLELLARVRAVVRRYQSQLPAVGETFESGGLRIDYASRTVTVNGNVIRLTPTEYSLLYHLSRNAGRVLPHQTLLAKVWGREYTDEIDYLKVYIRRLRQKLEGDPQTIGEIVSERGVGYKFVAA